MTVGAAASACRTSNASGANVSDAGSAGTRFGELSVCVGSLAGRAGIELRVCCAATMRFKALICINAAFPESTHLPLHMVSKV